MRRAWLPAGLVLACALAAGAFERFDPRSQVPLGPLLEVIVVPRSVLAIDATTGGEVEERLELGERVVWHDSRGRVAAAITTRRLLAVATNSAAWQELDFRLSETHPETVLLGDRVGLAATSQRVVGFSGGSGNLVESSLGPREKVLRRAVGENVAVLVTDRRALGLSPFVGGFFEIPIQLAERIEGITAKANLVTVRTQRRLLIFRATTGSWESRSRTLDGGVSRAPGPAPAQTVAEAPVQSRSGRSSSTRSRPPALAR